MHWRWDVHCPLLADCRHVRPSKNTIHLFITDDGNLFLLSDSPSPQIKGSTFASEVVKSKRRLLSDRHWTWAHWPGNCFELGNAHSAIAPLIRHSKMVAINKMQWKCTLVAQKHRLGERAKDCKGKGTLAEKRKSRELPPFGHWLDHWALILEMGSTNT